MSSGPVADQLEPVPQDRRGLTRRGVLRGGGAVAFVGLSAAALKLPFFGVDGAQVAAASCVGKDISASDKRLVISNWPAYIDPRRTKKSTSSVFEQTTGITVVYTPDVNDNSEFYAKVKNQLGSCQSVKRDMMVLTDWMAARMIDLGWIQKLDTSKIPNVTNNIIDALRGRDWDPDFSYHVPWQSGLTGIAYNAEATGEVRSFEELLTRSDLKGKISLLTEMRDTMGFLLKMTGADPGDFSRGRVAQRARQAAVGGECGPGAGVHRQRVHPGPRRREHRGLRGVVRRRHPGPGRQPGDQVRDARRRTDALERQHARAEPRPAPVERRALDELLLRPRRGGEARRGTSTTSVRSRAPRRRWSSSTPTWPATP